MTFEQGSSANDAISQINVTPLVDVMLVLLIIFMVTAPILQQGVSVDLPKVAAGPLAGQEEQLVVNVGKAGQLFLNDTPLTPEQLTTKLAAIAAARPDRQLYVRADQAVSYGQVMRVMGAVHDAGLTRVGLVTEPPAEPKPAAAAEEPAVPIPEQPRPPEPKPEAKPPEPPKPEAKPLEFKPAPKPPEPPKAEVKKPEPPALKPAPKPPEPPKPPPAKAPEPPKAMAARPGGPAGKEEAAPHDAYGAAAERWRQRIGGGLGGNDGGSGPIGSGGEGKGGGGQLVGLEFIAYRQQVINTIKARWTNVIARPGLVAGVRFEIAPDGQVSNVRLAQSSGNAAYDASAMRAVQHVGQLPPPPARYVSEFREFVVEFHSAESGGRGAG